MNNENETRKMTEEEAQELLRLAEEMVANDKKAAAAKAGTPVQEAPRAEKPKAEASSASIRERIEKAKARHANVEMSSEAPEVPEETIPEETGKAAKPEKKSGKQTPEITADTPIDEATANAILEAAEKAVGDKKAKKLEAAKKTLERDEEAERKRAEKAAAKAEKKAAKKAARDEKRNLYVDFLDGFSNLPVIRFFVNSKSVGVLILKILLMILIPFAFLFLCGFIFETLLMYFGATLGIFIGWIALIVINLFFIVLAVIRFSRYKKH